MSLLVALALLCYGLSFVLPDHWWHGPTSHAAQGPPGESKEIVRYVGPQMAAAFRESLRADRLDWAGWVGHGLQWLAFLLVAVWCDRMALTAAVLSLIFGLARFAACMPNGFMAGYYFWLASIVLLGLAGLWGFRIARRRELGKWGRRFQKLTAQLTCVALAGFLVWYLTCTGPRELASYPDRETSPYRLPYPAGKTCLCAQGNWAIVSHRSMAGGSVHAYDFAMRVGSDVVAARAGQVVDLRMESDGFGAARNNSILIRHEDGTFAAYMHLMKGGSYVKLGERVEQGQLLAASGSTGTSSGPHLHFMVLRNNKGQWESLAVAFSDVMTDQGIPRMFKWYTSGNERRK
jgi:hypothetical protein